MNVCLAGNEKLGSKDKQPQKLRSGTMHFKDLTLWKDTNSVQNSNSSESSDFSILDFLLNDSGRHEPYGAYNAAHQNYLNGSFIGDYLGQDASDDAKKYMNLNMPIKLLQR